MANRLKMAIVQSILSLHAQGWSARRIAKALEVHRDTVSRYVRAAASAAPKPANAPILPGRVPDNSKPATARRRATAMRRSALAWFRHQPTNRYYLNRSRVQPMRPTKLRSVPGPPARVGRAMPVPGVSSFSTSAGKGYRSSGFGRISAPKASNRSVTTVFGDC